MGERRKLGGSSCVPFWSRHAFLNKFDTLGGYHFLPNRGGLKMLGGSQNFFMRNRGVIKKIKRFLDGYKF